MQIPGPDKVKLWGQEATISPPPGVSETGDPRRPSMKGATEPQYRK